MRNPPTDRQTLVATALWATAVIAALALHPPARIATLAMLFLGPLAWAVWRFPWRSDPSTVTLPRGFILPRGWRLAIDPTYYEPTWRAVLYHGLMWTLMACVVGPFIVGPLRTLMGSEPVIWTVADIAFFLLPITSIDAWICFGLPSIRARLNARKPAQDRGTIRSDGYSPSTPMPPRPSARPPAETTQGRIARRF